MPKPDLPLCVSAVLSALIFIVETRIPLGVAGGVPYVIAVLFATRSATTHAVRLSASLCILLTLLGYFISPESPPGTHWQAITNRILSVLAIAATTWAGEGWQQSRAKLQAAVGELHARLDIASTIQARLFPQSHSGLDGLDVFGIIQPADQLCGDYYDIIKEQDGSVTVVVADVSGHGPGAALIMTETRAILRRLFSGISIGIGTVVSELNQTLFEDTPPETFVTLVAMRFDRSRTAVSYSGAGHHGLIVRSDGKLDLLPSHSLPLGLVKRSQYSVGEGKFNLNDGDLVLMHSDGLTETQNRHGELLGPDRVTETLLRLRSATAREVVTNLRTLAEDFSGKATFRDDLTIVAIKRARSDEAELLHAQGVADSTVSQPVS